MTSFRLDPFAPLDHVAREFLGAPAARAPRFMPMDLSKSEEGFVLTADLPGVDPASVKIDIDNGILTISAERTTGPTTTSGESDGVTWLANERFSGSYRRQVSVGDTVDTERISADFAGGVLTVTLPVAERAKTRRITVNHRDAVESTPTASVIDAQDESASGDTAATVDEA